ncbi:MAG TPA: dihydrofolate reductase [Candidatus Cloacimonadota bacterium]|nr:dihydrofolate reductase [Candidatus Cloacimonadota bacterium]
MIVSIIVAMTPDRVIGKDNRMPWHIPEELAYFRKTTLGKPVIMGRQTFQSIGKILDKRQNIVLSADHTLSLPEVQRAESLQEAIKLATGDEVFIIGGARVYQQALAIADKLYVTYIYKAFEGDKYFPELDNHIWEITSHQEQMTQQGIRLEFVVYERVYII